MNMKHFLKGAAAVAIVMVIVIGIHMIFNMNGREVPVHSAVEVFLAGSLATFIYSSLTKNEKQD